MQITFCWFFPSLLCAVCLARGLGCGRVAFPYPPSGVLGGRKELRTPEGPQISSISSMFWRGGGSVKSPDLIAPQSASADDTGYRPQVSRLLFILATAVQQSQEHGSSYPRIICFCCFMPGLQWIPALGQRIEVVRVTERKRA